MSFTGEMSMNVLSRSIAGALAIAAFALGLFGPGAAHATAILTGNFAADNYAFVYLSTSADSRGTLIGQSSGWNPATALSPTNLADGTYYLNVEVINADSGLYSQGGFLGDFSLSGNATFSTGGTRLLTGASGWLASYNNSNFSYTQQAWVTPTGTAMSEGANGISPWGTISGISGSANWIWASDLQSGLALGTPGTQCAACTIDFQTQLTVVSEPASLSVMLIGLTGLAALRRRRGQAGAAEC